MPISNCINCEIEFRWMPSQKSGKYCSHDCQINHALAQKIASGKYTRANALTYFKRTTEYKCVECNNKGIYQGKPLKLQIDHIDGNNENNKIENYRYLCPNCHSQTDTWGVKNASEEGKQRMIEGAKKGRRSQIRKQVPSFIG